MKIQFQCPGCKQKSKGNKEYVGRKATCPKCKTKFTLEPFQPSDSEEPIVVAEVVTEVVAQTEVIKPAPPVKVSSSKIHDTRPGHGSFVSRFAGPSGASCPSRIPMNPFRFAIRNPLVPVTMILLFILMLAWSLYNEKPTRASAKSTSAPVDGMQRINDRLEASKNPRDPLDRMGFSKPAATPKVSKDANNSINKNKLKKYGMLFGLFFGFGGIYYYNKFKHFMRGDGNPGVVVALNPTLVAVATDLSQVSHERPAIKIIRTKLKRSQGKELKVGSIIATAAQYGTAAFGNQDYFASFDPIPVEEATANESYIASLIHAFDRKQYELLNLVKLLPKPHQPGLYLMWPDGDQQPPRRAPRGLFG